jgi:hypothetical protein
VLGCPQGLMGLPALLRARFRPAGTPRPVPAE